MKIIYALFIACYLSAAAAYADGLPANPWAGRSATTNARKIRYSTEQKKHRDNKQETAVSPEIEWAKQRAAAVRKNNARVEEVYRQREIEAEKRRIAQAEARKKAAQSSDDGVFSSTLDSIAEAFGSKDGAKSKPKSEPTPEPQQSNDDWTEMLSIDKATTRKAERAVNKLKNMMNFDVNGIIEDTMKQLDK